MDLIQVFNITIATTIVILVPFTVTVLALELIERIKDGFKRH